MNSDERALLKFAISQDEDSPDAAIERLGNTRALTLLITAASNAIRRRFQPGNDSAIRSFVDHLPERFQNEALNVGHAETLILATLVDPDLIDPLSYDDLLAACFLVTYAIMSHENLDYEGREQYFAAVVKEADGL